jgi:hypothetical protein
MGNGLKELLFKSNLPTTGDTYAHNVNIDIKVLLARVEYLQQVVRGWGEAGYVKERVTGY